MPASARRTHAPLARIAVTGAIAIAAFHPGRACAQSPWLERGGSTSVLLEILKPDFKATGVGFSTLASFVSVRRPLSGDVALIAELPFAHWQYSGASGSSTTIGN